MNLLFLQNCEFEKPGILLDWANERNIPFKLLKAYEEPLPAPESFTHLVLLGSPHSVHEMGRIEWLKAEAEYAREFMEEGKHTFGICLGAQIIAHLLGGEVVAGPHAEVGWHRVGKTGDLPPAVLFQWHREIFSLPPGATPFGESAATGLQGFWKGERILALAGHPEITESLVKEFIDLCWSEDWYEKEVAGNRAGYIQRPEEMIREARLRIAESRSVIFAWLDAWAGG